MYIYENSEITDEVKNIIDNKKIETLNIKNLKNITDDERDRDETYISIMYNNLEELKKELYNSN